MVILSLTHGAPLMQGGALSALDFGQEASR